MATIIRPLLVVTPARIHSRTAIESGGVEFLEPNLISKDFVAFSQHDWQLPKSPIFNPERLNFVEGTDLELISKDTMFRGTGFPLQNYDFPLPTPVLQLAKDWSYSSVRYELVGLDNLRIDQTDWPLPNRVLQNKQLDHYDLITAPIGVKSPFFSSVTEIVARLFQNAKSPDSQFIAPSGGIQPFSQSDWPNPSKIATKDLGFSFNPSIYFPIPSNPLSQSDWPSPAKLLQKPQEFMFWYVQSQANPPEAPDFPDPVRALSTIKVDYPNVVITIPIVTPALINNQDDWPLPTSPLLTLKVDYFNGLITIPPIPPINQDDWPVPVKTLYNVNLGNFTDSTKLNLQNQDFRLINESDWPTPKQFSLTVTVIDQQSNIVLRTSNVTTTTPWCAVTAFSQGGISGGGDIDVW